MTREAVEQLGRKLSRRAFFGRAVNMAGIGLAFDRFGDRLLGADRNATAPTDPVAVYGAIGNIVIPIDQDPGWATFEPDISKYGLNVMVGQVLLGGDPVAFGGVSATMVAINEVPPLVNYGTHRFLEMSEGTQSQYLGDILTGQFENDGVQDIVLLGVFVALFSTKAVFFSNFPNHLSKPGAEFQDRTPSALKTGWDIMGYKGPVSAAEEKALRERYANARTFPGMDPKNTYI